MQLSLGFSSSTTEINLTETIKKLIIEKRVVKGENDCIKKELVRQDK